MELLETNKDVMDFFGTYPIVGSSLRVTMGCNAKCKHCYTMGGRKLENEYTTEQILEIIDQLSKMNIAQMFFTGGEPFLRKDIVKILNYANEKGIDILISTNGSILKEETIQQIEHIKFKQFQVSIDGIGAWHDENRGVGFFEKADKTIDLLKKHNINNITIGTCITRDNIDELPQILEYVIKKEVDKFALMLLLPEGRATLEMDVKIEKLLEKLDEFWDIYRKNEIKFEFAENCVLPPVCIPKDLREKGLHKTFVVCCSFPNMMGISADGNVAPCDGFLGWKNYIAGNIYKDKIENIWNKMINDSNIIPPNVTDIKGVCSKCIYLKECGGNCRADAVAQYGDILAPYPICQKLYDAGKFPKECLRDD